MTVPVERQFGMQILKAGVIYFALVFGAGFVLGPIRVLWVVPRLGESMAELLEMPIMLGVIILATRWMVMRRGFPTSRSRKLGVGLAALALLLTAEFTMVLGLRGMTINEYFASRDPVAGTAYALMLVVFALMPVFVTR